MEALSERLLEMLVVAGMDDVTGLVPSQPQPPAFFHHENKLFSTAFEAQILAAISSNVATFPTQSEPKDPNYPPATVKLDRKSKANNGPAHKSAYKTWASSKPKQRAAIKKKAEGGSFSQRNKSRASSFRVFDLASHRQSSNNLTLTPTEMPLSSDTLQSLITFCYPDGAYVKESRCPSTVHYLVMTDIDGDRSYAVCVTAYRKHSVTKSSDEERWQLSAPDTKTIANEARPGTVVFVPRCYVAVCKAPYFTVLTDCLSLLVERAERGADSWSHVLKEFSLHLTHVPLPPCGPLTLEVRLFQESSVHIPPPVFSDQPAVDQALWLPFLHLGADLVLTVMSAILCEQRLVFVSAHNALMVLVCECFQRLLYPFSWIYTYVPLLSWNLIELVEAPGTFIMGCNARERPSIDQVEGLVLVDLDLGEVRVCPSLTLPRMPSAAAHVFILALQQARRHTDWLGMGRVTSFCASDHRREELRHRQRINTTIQTACLELMANVFREVFYHTNKEKRFFHKEQFLENVDDKDLSFYEQVLQCDLFGEFMKSQMNPDLADSHWTEFLEKTKPYNRNSLQHGMVGSSQPVSPCRRPKSFTNLSTSLLSHGNQCSGELLGVWEYTVLAWPGFVYGLSHMYVANCLLELDNAVKSLPSVDARAVVHYLRALLLGSQHRHQEALQALSHVENTSRRVYPARFASSLLAAMTPSDRDQLTSSPLYQKSSLLRLASNRQAVDTSPRQPIIMELSKIPQADIDEQGFSELVQLLCDVSTDAETLTRLFDALTLGERTAVDPYTFEEFYQSWKENEVSLGQVRLPASLLDPGEVLLRVSDMCRSSLGTGRLALTPKRLFFLHEGSRKCREVIQLSHIKKLDIVQQRTLLKPVTALKVFATDERIKPFIMTLKDSCQEWSLLVSEMWSGRLLSEELRNPNILLQASQNVLLVSAFIQSGQSEFANHRGYEMEEAESLCYFRLRRAQGAALSLEPETRELLQHQIDPSSTEPERTAVEDVLYIPGRRTGVATEDFGPRLWVALASGRVAVYDATCWAIETLRSLSVHKLTCLLAVSDRQVWIGCLDTNIYVLNQRTKLCTQTLSAHHDLVTALCDGNHGDHRRSNDRLSNHSDGTVYSSSVDGKILRWNTSSLTVTMEISLPDNSASLRSIYYHNHRLWACTREELLILSTNGDVLHRVSTEAIGLPAHIDCFILTPQNEVWVGLGRQGDIVVYYADNLEQKRVISIATRGISKMILVNNQVWVGCKDGQLVILSTLSQHSERSLQAHSDAIRTLASAHGRYVFSGAGSLDGRVAVWRINSA